MTYNFDPDKWYDIERELLESRLGSGEIGEQAFKSALEALDRRYDEMLDRLDGSYQIPK
jgi:hypothetical protein